MTTCTENSREHILRELQCKVEVKSEQVRRLEETLLTYNETRAERDYIKIQLDDMKNWLDDRDRRTKQMKIESKDDCEKQKEVLKNAEFNEAELQEEQKKLIDFKKRIIEQWKEAKSTKIRLLNEVDELEIDKNCIVSEFSSVKLDVEKKTCEVESMRRTFRCKEEELGVERRRLDECMVTHDRLTDTSKALERELSTIRVQLEEAKTRLVQTKEKWHAEKEDLSFKVDSKSRSLRDMRVELEAAGRTAAEEMKEVRRLERLATELRNKVDLEQAEVESRTRSLEREICAKRAALPVAEERAVQLWRENDAAAAELERLGAQVQAEECRLDEETRSADELKTRAEDRLCRLERDKAALAREVQAAAQRIAEAQREIGRLRHEIRQRGLHRLNRVDADGWTSTDRQCCESTSSSAVTCKKKELCKTREENEYRALCDDIEMLRSHACSLLEKCGIGPRTADDSRLSNIECST